MKSMDDLVRFEDGGSESFNRMSNLVFYSFVLWKALSVEMAEPR